MTKWFREEREGGVRGRERERRGERERKKRVGGECVYEPGENHSS